MRSAEPIATECGLCCESDTEYTKPPMVRFTHSVRFVVMSKIDICAHDESASFESCTACANETKRIECITQTHHAIHGDGKDAIRNGVDANVENASSVRTGKHSWLPPRQLPCIQVTPTRERDGASQTHSRQKHQALVESDLHETAAEKCARVWAPLDSDPQSRFLHFSQTSS